MHNLFPRMYDCPEGRQIAVGALYWVVYTIVLPFCLEIILFSDMSTNISIYCIAYFAVNFILTVLIFRPYLADSFWNVRLEKKRFFSSVGLGLAVFTAVTMLMFQLGLIFGDPFFVTYIYPVADAFAGLSPILLLQESPLWNGLSMIFLVPTTMCCLYYAVGFAPVAQNRPWLGYLIVAAFSAVPMVLRITSMGYDTNSIIIWYLALLPFHMCACWVYQRSDTIWGPIAFHTIVNLLFTPLAIVASYIVLY